MKIKNLCIVLLLLITICTLPEEITLMVSNAQPTHMQIAILMLNNNNNELKDVAITIKKDLEFTDQFKLNIQEISEQLSKKELRKKILHYGAIGTPIVLCINIDSSENIEWRLYETMQCTMIQGKKYKKNGNIARSCAHAVADELYKTLTANDGFFSSRLVYCKDVNNNNKGLTVRKIYVADFDGSHEELLVDTSTITVAPRWHITKPCVYYSEYADTNVRLISSTMNKKNDIISSFDGINMLMTFSPNGKSAYCSSRGNGSCQIYLQENNILKRCTKNSGNNTSPIFLDEDRLCFCSDFQTGNPQIYIANLKTGHIQRITKGGYCTSPNYCLKTNKIVYHKMIQRTMQIMIYNCATKEHVQITSTNGNKHEASWSPDGTQILFAHEVPNKTSRLASLNLLTNKTKYITGEHEQCSYPHWGPIYTKFPVVT
ncbi:MAG TPA: hypothetical protein VLB80_01135 [Candidatus Babeliales bacterium]|nr:hypothetical protein [Candidatus Babeliales bacterium]